VHLPRLPSTYYGWYVHIPCCFGSFGQVSQSTVTTPSAQSAPGIRIMTIDGFYPQVFAKSISVDMINAKLRSIVIKDETSSLVQARAYYTTDKSLGQELITPAHYEVWPSKKLMSASTLLVSVLLPTESTMPGGVNTMYWLSATLLVPTGTSINLSDIFSNPKTGLQLIARIAKRLVLKANNCVNSSYHDRINRHFFDLGIAPTISNYDDFVFTSSGLDIGFSQGQLAGDSCRITLITIPFNMISSQLNR
jgi:hypothetical protein